jgi:hypothetical protein
MRDIEKIAVDALRCATSWEMEACLVGNVTAREVARLAIPHITSCPKCGAEPWVNIDCDLCLVCSVIESGETEPRGAECGVCEGSGWATVADRCAEPGCNGTGTKGGE